MAVIAATIGIIIILLGFMVATEKVDTFWKNRATTPTAQIRMTPLPPPFLTSLTQCVICGTDDDLLNLDRICYDCFNLKVSTHE